MPNDTDNDIYTVLERRRSTRKFEQGRAVDRAALDRIINAGRWAPSGANVQCWDFIVVDDPETREAVRQVFLRQAQRLRDHAKGFPAVAKDYLANTVAIVVVLGDPRWKVCFSNWASGSSSFPFILGWDRVSGSRFSSQSGLAIEGRRCMHVSDW